jgi:nitrogen regulatory protein PII
MKREANQSTLKEKTIWELLDTKLVKSASIKSLLKRYKVPSEEKSRTSGKGKRKSSKAKVHTSATSKKILVERNLQIAVNSNIIPLEQAYDLLREGEENGAQRIFFYLPRSKAVATRCSDGATICEKLHGSSDPVKLGFPKLLEGWTDEPVTADFRYDKRQWIAKWYWRQVQYVTLQRDVLDGMGKNGIPIYKRTYQKIEERAVMVARWNGHSLELRVPNSANRNSLVLMVNRLWNLLASGLQRHEFEEWNLEPASTKIIKEAVKNVEIYDFGDTILRDSAGGTTVFNTKPPEPAADEGGQFHIPFAPEQKQALDVILDRDKNTSERVVVHWKKALAVENTNQNDKKQKPPDPLRVVIAAEDKNEVSIGAKTTAKAIDYVIYRLRDFSPKVS